MGKQGGLVAAYLLDGKGGGRLLDWQALGEWRPDDGFLWVHLDRRAKESRRWLREIFRIRSRAQAASPQQFARPY